MPSLIVMAVFYFIAFANYGFSVHHGLVEQHTIVRDQSVWQAAIASPGLFIAGLFFSYKLFWFLFVGAVWKLREQKCYGTMKGLLFIVLFPVLLTLVAWNTARVGAFGFLGVLLALDVWIRDSPRASNRRYYLLSGILLANLLIPSYDVMLSIGSRSLTDYPYPGLYMLIHSAIRSLGAGPV